MSSIHEGNNDAVEHLLLGNPTEAINVLLRSVNSFQTQSVMGEISIDGEYKNLINESLMQMDVEMEGYEDSRQLYSVDLSDDLEVVEPAYPFQWYGKPIAITSRSECAEDGSPYVPLNLHLNLAVLFYNLGIAYQMEAARKEQLLGASRSSVSNAFHAYSVALKASLMVHEEKIFSVYHELPIGERLDLGLVQAAIVNNMLFLYAQGANMQGMSTCLGVLREILYAVCYGLQPCDTDEFKFFHANVVVFQPPGMMSLSPAA